MYIFLLFICRSFLHLGAGLSVGLSGLAAGFAIGIVGDAGVRGTAQQPRLFVGMILILIFAEVLGLYGLIVALILSVKWSRRPCLLCKEWSITNNNILCTVALSLCSSKNCKSYIPMISSMSVPLTHLNSSSSDAVELMAKKLGAGSILIWFAKILCRQVLVWSLLELYYMWQRLWYVWKC